MQSGSPIAAKFLIGEHPFMAIKAQAVDPESIGIFPSHGKALAWRRRDTRRQTRNHNQLGGS